MPTSIIVSTRSGKQLDLLQPDPAAIDLHDIAGSLSKQCRYNGHTQQFYSVAQHSVLLAEAVPSRYAALALLHDAPEAYVGDLVQPLKAEIADYQALEQAVWQAICAKFLWLDYDEKGMQVVREYDRRICLNEAEAQLPRVDTSAWGISTPLDLHPLQFRGWDPAEAEAVFLGRARELASFVS
jgi:5'-deoxynucleotidase YfbR-like HD superfamily hydrolase